MKNDNLHVVIACDSNYLPHSHTLSKSIIESNRGYFQEIHIHLLANNISVAALTQFTDQVTKDGATLHIYDIGDIKQRLGINIPKTISICSYARLFIPSLIQDDIDRIIYMDVDAINTAPLNELYDLDLNGVSVAGVLDDVALKAKLNVGLKPDSPYINAGFLLINLKYWKVCNLQGKFIEFLHRHGGNVFHHDQGIINAVCNSSMKILHPRYNMVSNFFSQSHSSFTQKPFYSEYELSEGKLNPVFIHFTPGVVNRPWLKNCRHPKKDIYLKFRSKTISGIIPLPYDNRPFKLRFLSFLFFNCRWAYNTIISVRSKITDSI